MNKKLKIEELVKNYRIPFEKGKDEVWSEIQSELDQIPEKIVIPFYRRKLSVLAASLISVFLVFSVLYEMLFSHKNYRSLAGIQQQILMPDSTKILLNPNSKLSVHYSLVTGKRNVHLKGEALFDVKPGKEFIVRFEGGSLKVLGTKFTVDAFKNGPATINCLNGRVQVYSGKQKLILTVQTGAVVSEKSGMIKVNADKETVLAEINGEFIWNNVPLLTAFIELENRFGYKVEAEKLICARNFSGHIKMQNMEEACTVLSFAMNLKYSVNKQTKTIVFEESD